MAIPIKLSEEELNELKLIQSTYQEKIYAFGQLYIDKLNLVEQQKEMEKVESQLKQDLNDNQKKEQNWMNDMSTKSGEGSLSLKDGTFTPNKK